LPAQAAWPPRAQVPRTDWSERGTGRFDLTLGATSAGVGIGAYLRQTIADSSAHHWNSNAGFLFLAAAAFGIRYVVLPEIRDKQLLSHNP
jgi:hypothetical protein